MAPAAPPEPEENPYKLLDISQEATDAEIRTAYRTRSLKVHPDRNRNDPNAAQKFHALTVASTLLLDPLRRLALDAQLRLAEAKKARFASYDNKRKALVTELEEREREFKKARQEKAKEKAAREGENDRVKEAGRRMREERERQREELARAKLEEARIDAEEEATDTDAPPPMGPYDTTIRVKFTLSAFPSLSTASALASHLRRFGEIDEGAVVLSIKPKKPSKKKKAQLQDKGADEEGKGEGEKLVNAVVPFAQISSAFGAISSGPTLKERGMEVSWVGGSEPPILGWLRDRGELGGKPQSTSPAATSSNNAPGKVQTTDELPQTTNVANGAKFSTFPSTLPHHILNHHRPQQKPPAPWISNRSRFYGYARRNVQD
ncbi:DnaJ-domain-containing protein [Paxillus ammoniavirescens]|nr:DnaJ-domain-containing protein [Paxillus ammoniavirescens]